MGSRLGDDADNRGKARLDMQGQAQHDQLQIAPKDALP